MLTQTFVVLFSRDLERGYYLTQPLATLNSFALLVGLSVSRGPWCPCGHLPSDAILAALCKLTVGPPTCPWLPYAIIWACEDSRLTIRIERGCSTE